MYLCIQNIMARNRIPAFRIEWRVVARLGKGVKEGLQNIRTGEEEEIDEDV